MSSVTKSLAHVLGGAVLVVLSAALPARAQYVDARPWGTNGTVAAVLRTGSTIYVAGSFDSFCPNTGGGVEVDPHAGAALATFPVVAGVVEVAIPDGAGGWYIGGQFGGVGGHQRRNLARVLADGKVADWAPDPDAPVDALAYDGATLFVGGRFTRIAGVDQGYLASFDASTGMKTPWAPAPDRRIRALLCYQGVVYVGGEFSVIGGQSRWAVAAYDCATGFDTGLDLRLGFQGGPGSVRTMAAIGDTLYVGGYFGLASGQQRLNACAIDLQSQGLLPWNPDARGTNDMYFGSSYVSAIAIRGSGVLVGGHFTRLGGVPRAGLAEVDRSQGLASAWTPLFGLTRSDSSADISSIVIDGDSAYVAGIFFGVNGSERDYCAKLALGSSGVCRWDPQPTGAVHVIAPQCGRVFLGGPFAGLGTQGVRRAGLAAFDATTGMVKEWNPNPVGYGVQTLALSRGQLYVGGSFWEIGGQPCDGLAAVDTLTGAATGWHPQVDNWPLSLEPVGDTLFVGGAFKVVEGQPRGRLAAFGLTTGALTDWAPYATSDVSDIEVRDSMVVIAGGFNYVNGVPRLHGLAAVNRYSGDLFDWNPQPSGWASAIKIVGDTVIVGGAFNTIGGQSRSNLAALDLRTGQALDWRADANGQVNTLAMIGDTLFAGGFYYLMAGQPRNSLAAVDLRTGALLDWDLGLSSIEYGFSNPVVWGLASADHTLYVGGAFGRAGLVPAAGLAAYSFGPPPPEPPTLPTAIALATISPNPVLGPMSVRFDLPSPLEVSLTIYDLQGRRLARPLDHARQGAGRHSLTLDASRWPRGFYFCLLEAGGVRLARKFVVLR